MARQAAIDARRGLSNLVESANERNIEFETLIENQTPVDSFVVGKVGEAVLDGSKDNSCKAYYKEFKKVVDEADVILEVLDARDPLGCRTRKIEELILASNGGEKRIVLVLNKIGKY